MAQAAFLDKAFRRALALIGCVCLSSFAAAKSSPSPVHAAPAATASKPAPAAASAKAASSAAAPVLDTARVRKLYLDGDFEEAIPLLEGALKGGKAYTHSDSVFIFKHLGVMYAAKYETREMGKHYMFLLLATEPTARIMDMYASDMIYMIFKNIQEEFESTRVRMERADGWVQNNARPDSAQTAKPAENKPAEPKPALAKAPGKSGHAGWYWAGAAGATAVVGTVAYFYMADRPAKVNSTDHEVKP